MRGNNNVDCRNELCTRQYIKPYKGRSNYCESCRIKRRKIRISESARIWYVNNKLKRNSTFGMVDIEA